MQHDQILQNMTFPDAELGHRPESFFKLEGGCFFNPQPDEKNGYIAFFPAAAGKAVFCSARYFNLFSLRRWQQETMLEQLSLKLCGEGDFWVKILHYPHYMPASPAACRAAERTSPHLPVKSQIKAEVIHEQALSLSSTHEIDLGQIGQISNAGEIAFELTALSNGILRDAAYITRTSPCRDIHLLLSITSYNRPAALKQTVRRLAPLKHHSNPASSISLQIINNGETLPNFTAFGFRTLNNPNLGGAGGFARGLLEARETKATHMLICDDDAGFSAEAVRRIANFLAYATNPRTAIAASMIDAATGHHLWESGAVYKGLCKAFNQGCDIASTQQTLSAERNLPDPENDLLYGGWWMFAFPLQQAQHLPFPFFVRGDDIGFSLQNDFRINLLPGVAAMQAGFSAKEGPTIHYLDTRYHLVLQLALKQFKQRSLASILYAFWHVFYGNLRRKHYESAKAALLALKHVMKGPDFFRHHIMMQAPSREIDKLINCEKWQPIKGPQPAETTKLPARWKRVIAMLSFNGCFMPFFRKWGQDVVLPIAARGLLEPTRCARSITYIDQLDGCSYRVEINALAAVSLLAKAIAASAIFLIKGRGLRKRYNNALGDFTSTEFWQEQLNRRPITPQSNRSKAA